MTSLSRRLRRRVLTSTAIGTVTAATVLTLGSAANAQDAQQADDDEAVEEIVVTGSRIVRSNLTSPAPVISVSSEDILSSGEVDISRLLREVPALQGTVTATDSVSSANPDGASLLNLRQLGSERSLTLVNGRRHVSGIASSTAVDVQTIPLALIERVETVTAASSAIYGADAVTGAVNFILKDDFEGLSYRAQGGVDDNTDMHQYLLSAAGGFNFDDGRGNAVVTMEYQSTTPLFHGDRPKFAADGLARFAPNSQAIIDALGTNPNARNTFFDHHRIPITSSFGLIGIFDSNFPPLFTSDLIDDPALSFCSVDDIFCRLIPGVPGAQVIDESGNLRPFDAGVVAGFFDAFGGDGIPTSDPRDALTTGINKFTVNANFNYQINEYINFFGENKFSYTDAFDRLGVSGFNDQIPIRLDNPFIPQGIQAQIQSAMDQGITPAIIVARDTLDFGVPDQNSDRYTFRSVLGFEGQFDNGWTWEISYNFGRTEVNTSTNGARLDDRFQAGIDAVALTSETINDLPSIANKALRDGEVINITAENAQVGDIVCRSTIDPSAEPPVDPIFPHRPGFNTFSPGDGSCVPFSIFGPNAISAEGAEFFTHTSLDNEEVTQQVISAIFTGDLGQLPAGDLGWAAGFEWRKEESEDVPDALDQAGLTFGTFDGEPQPVFGDFTVKEFFGEVNVPILSGVTFFEELSIGAAARYSDYSTVGNTTTWSFNANWSISNEFRLRATFGRAIRAPNIFELFSPQQPLGFNPDDPCDPAFIDAGSEFREQNCETLVGPDFQDTLTARIIGVEGGNRDINEERGETLTIGAVVTPDALPGLAVTIDYWDIEITDAIDNVDPQSIFDRCVDAPTLDNEFCDLQRRNPNTGNLSFFESVQSNIGALKARGIDFEVSYNTELLGGSVRGVARGTRTLRLLDFPFQDFPDERENRLFEAGNPKWIANFNVDYSRDRWTLYWQTRLQSSTLLVGVNRESFEADLPSDEVFVDPYETGIGLVHDFSVTYQAMDNLRINAGVNNIANRKPFFSFLTLPTNGIGRFLFLGVEGNF